MTRLWRDNRSGTALLNGGDAAALPSDLRTLIHSDLHESTIDPRVVSSWRVRSCGPPLLPEMEEVHDGGPYQAEDRQSRSILQATAAVVR
jgi:hypothetical protein